MKQWEKDFAGLAKAINDLSASVEHTPLRGPTHDLIRTWYDVIEWSVDHEFDEDSIGVYTNAVVAFWSVVSAWKRGQRQAAPVERVARCSNCDREFTTTSATKKWCATCSRAGMTMVAIRDREGAV